MYAKPSEVHSEAGVLRGEWRGPINIASRSIGSIHDDQKAVELGFRGGLVSGLLHNESIVPVALHGFGPGWFEHGGYSFYYRTPTLTGEEARASMHEPGPNPDHVMVDAWVENGAGETVAAGNAWLGNPAADTGLSRRLALFRSEGEPRILAKARVGDALGKPRIVRATREMQVSSRGTTTEPLDWFYGDSPWGGPIASSRGMYGMLKPRDAIAELESDGVRIDGGIEVRFINGPVFLEKDYLSTARILAVGQSPTTEALWFESELTDPADGRVIAQKLMLCLWVKKSSALYAEGK